MKTPVLAHTNTEGERDGGREGERRRREREEREGGGGGREGERETASE